MVINLINFFLNISLKVWSYRLDTERREVLIERSITKSGELSLPYLASIGILTFSQMKANTPTNPSQLVSY